MLTLLQRAVPTAGQEPTPLETLHRVYRVPGEHSALSAVLRYALIVRLGVFHVTVPLLVPCVCQELSLENQAPLLVNPVHQVRRRVNQDKHIVLCVPPGRQPKVGRREVTVSLVVLDSLQVVWGGQAVGTVPLAPPPTTSPGPPPALSVSLVILAV